MGLFSILWKVIAILVLAVVFLAAYGYFSDHTVKGEVVGKGRDGVGPWVDVKLNPLGITHRSYIDADAEDFVCTGYQVHYKVRSEALRVEDPQGRTIYDSQNGGLQSFQGALRCRVSNPLL